MEASASLCQATELVAVKDVHAVPTWSAASPAVARKAGPQLLLLLVTRCPFQLGHDLTFPALRREVPEKMSGPARADLVKALFGKTHVLALLQPDGSRPEPAMHHCESVHRHEKVSLHLLPLLRRPLVPRADQLLEPRLRRGFLPCEAAVYSAA